MEAMGSFELPTLDLAHFLQEGSRRQEFADRLRDSLIQHGFVKIVNHGISESSVEQLFDRSREFFNLSVDLKSQLAHTPGPRPQRGWSHVGLENTARSFGALHKKDEAASETSSSDLKEHLDMGSPADLLYPNKWLGESHLPGFRPFLEDFFTRCHEVALLLLTALEVSFSLPAGSFTNKCRQEAGELRLNHYPPLVQTETSSVNRAWAHTDLGVITCLLQDSIGGLEIEDRTHRGQFQRVSPGHRSELVVNSSETLERWTNGKIRAGVHRVVAPPSTADNSAASERVVPERYSIPFFVKADNQTSVGPLPEFLSSSNDSSYKEMSAIEYYQTRNKEAYV
ncbi:oxidoreductase [Fusarium sp. MPI-SDFR-AT-0072]|nr:oxidoreductase [Fusarium sp. MPI-SDFR-AT-0072]